MKLKITNPKSIQGLECCLKLLSGSSRKHILNADLPRSFSSLKKKMERRKKVREERREGGVKEGGRQEKTGWGGKRENEKKTFIFH